METYVLPVVLLIILQFSCCISLLENETDSLKKHLIIETSLGEKVVLRLPLDDGINNITKFSVTHPNGFVQTMKPANTCCNSTIAMLQIQKKDRQLKTDTLLDDVEFLGIEDSKYVINEAEFTKTGTSRIKTKLKCSQDSKHIGIQRKIDKYVLQFAIDSVTVEDHGNWVLSVNFEENGLEKETYYIVSVIVTSRQRINNGDTLVIHKGKDLHISFKTTINGLYTCQCFAPESAGDRERQYFGQENCLYVIRDVTFSDSGEWTIHGVGKINYVGKVNVFIIT